MGETITGNINRLAEPPKSSPNPGTGGSAPGKQASRNSSSPAPGTGNAPAAGSGTPAGGKTAGTAEEKKVSGLASVTPPPVPETPKKKQRKPRQKKQETPSSFNADQITALIVSMSSIVASRPGLDMFAISDMEAKQIATPLSNMIAKSEQLKQLSEHADALALVTACIVVMAPRIMLYLDAQKQKKLNAAGGVKLVRTDNENRKNDGSSSKSDRPAPRKPENDVSGLYAAMPPISGEY